MSETVHPGVFIEEIEWKARPIEGVPTSTAVFVGGTERAERQPRLLASHAEYRQWFGAAAGAGRHTAIAAAGFFENGGQRLVIVPVGGDCAPADWDRALERLDDEELAEASLVHAPGIGDPDDAGHVRILRALIAHCEGRGDRFAVLDGPAGSIDPATFDPRRVLGETAYAAVYHPWIDVADPDTGAAATAPPGGHVLGVYARTDLERGVFKAPAGETLRGAAGLAQVIDDAGQALLNPRGVNLIRSFAGRGILVWGARTLSPDAEWKYVPVRRTVIFLEHSIDRGIQWVVFEPNAEPTWVQVRAAVEQFLLDQWRGGALQGSRPQDAFYVRCDRGTMTQADIDTGRLVCEVGVALVRPAEFVIFRIGQWTAEAQS